MRTAAASAQGARAETFDSRHRRV